jgi:hypothetical protein
MRNVHQSSPYKEESRQAEVTAVQNVEQFRFEASAAFVAFNQKQRKWAKELASGQFSAIDFYEKYHKEFKPLVTDLITQPDNATFVEDLKKHLQTDDATAVEAINELILQRKQQAIREFLASIPPRSNRRAQQLLELPMTELDQLYSSLRAYSVYSYIADKLMIPVFDPHASTIRRMIVRRKIKAERRKRDKNESKRLRYLAEQMRKFEKEEGDIASLLAAKNLDLMLILAARNDYEKAKAKVSSKAPRSKIEEMRLFESSVSTLVEQYVSTYIGTRNIASLQEIHREETDVKTLLLRIFELDTATKNRLVVMASDYKKLYDQTQQILADQSNRAVYLAKES